MSMCNINYDCGDNAKASAISNRIVPARDLHCCAYCGSFIRPGETHQMIVWESSSDSNEPLQIQHICIWCATHFEHSEINVINTDDADFKNDLIYNIGLMALPELQAEMDKINSWPQGYRAEFALRFPAVLMQLERRLEVRMQLERRLEEMRK